MTIPFDSPSGSARAPIREVEIVHLGDELLLGLRDNTHLTFLGRYFSNYGIKIRRDQVILDKHEDIVRFFGDSWGSSDLVITTGGLGPTVDDMTREAIIAKLMITLPTAGPDRLETLLHENFCDEITPGGVLSQG